jgi:hypothetical protein
MISAASTRTSRLSRSQHPNYISRRMVMASAVFPLWDQPGQRQVHVCGRPLLLVTVGFSCWAPDRRPADLAWSCNEAWAAQCSYCEQRAAHASPPPARPHSKRRHQPIREHQHRQQPHGCDEQPQAPGRRQTDHDLPFRRSNTQTIFIVGLPRLRAGLLSVKGCGRDIVLPIWRIRRAAGLLMVGG